MMNTINKAYRRAVTLIEVIFSIGVVLIGLLGLLSILPLAGRRSQEAISLSAAAAMGDAVFNELKSRKPLNTQGRLLAPVAAPTTPVQYDVDTRMLSIVGVGALSSFCIDPLYVTSDRTVTDIDGFDNRFFPYYSADHDPLINPSTPVTVGPPPVPVPWPAPLPRMIRVGLRMANTSTSSFQLMNLEQARTIVENPNDLFARRPKDRSQSAIFDALKSGTILSYGRRVPAGEFSWIATVSVLPGGRFANVSVVVLRRRDRGPDIPPSGTTDPERNAQNERLAYVLGRSGFVGGAGGSIRIASSQAVSDKISANSWMMLSRQMGGQEVHRWYRVVSADQESVKYVTTETLPDHDPGLGILLADEGFIPTAIGTSVWIRNVTLDGPDWQFSFRNDNPANDPPTPPPPLPPPTPPTPAQRFGDNTYVTILNDVVSVTERFIPLADL